MFVYLSKKIAIPNGVKLKCLRWNTEQGWIACGGENGLLKVLKLEMGDAKDKDPRNKGVSAPSNLSMNQTLEGHNGTVMVATWNENYRKLTTSDQYGLIIVWMLHKGIWFEEMINNRNKSVVRDMKWTSDGQRICIVYEDGAVIVGSVDGNRLWGKEVKLNLCLVEWSPDGRLILFGTLQGDVHIYDSQGNGVAKLLVPGMEVDESARIVGIDWYDGAEGYLEANQPSLALCYSNGRVTLMRHETDENPVLIDTMMAARKIEWNRNGDVLAVAGAQPTTLPTGEQREISMVQFYNPFGQHLRTLKVPGNGIQSLSWEGGGLRIALAVDSFIYFANIRPDYKWGYFGGTIVYAFTKPERPEHCVIFWDTKTDERQPKYVKKLLSIRACGEYCVLATKADDTSGQYILILCNAIGSPVDSKYIDIEPLFMTMSHTHVIVASEDVVYVWQFRTLISKLTSVGDAAIRRDKGRERVFHIDELPSASTGGFEKFKKPENPTNDTIAGLCASDKYLVVARESGTMHRYTIPQITLESKHLVRCRPQNISLNCNSTRLAIIDINGVLTFFDLDARADDGSGRLGAQLAFERKDVWDMRWADDNPELFAMMEKTRMYIFRGVDPEEPVLSSGYICEFTDLEVKAVLMDEILRTPDHPDRDYIINFETKTLRDTRELLQTVGLKECYTFVEDNPHSRLWRLLAEAALEQLDFAVADKAFVRCQDYQGIQFVKRLRILNDKIKQKAEVEAYFRRFDRAEELYRELDRKDLAVELRMRLGDWFRVVQLVSNGGGDDSLLVESWNRIADYYADRQKWNKAVQYYTLAKNNERLVECYYILEDYKGLERLIDALPEGSPYLSNIGDKFSSVGLAEQCVQAYLKASDVKGAIDACVHLNEWDRAIDLAEKYEFSQIEGLLSKYANHHLEKGEVLQAIALYRKACRHTDAAKLLARLGAESGATKVNPVRAKKLYLLSALEVERFKRKQLDTQMSDGYHTTTAASMTAHTLEGLVQHDRMTANDKVLESPWRGCEAYHFFLVAQRQLYEGFHDAAMKTALRLTEYDDILDPVDVYSLLALSSYYSKHFAVCSKAFVKLESLETIPKNKKDAYAALALNVFIRNPPNDPNSPNYKCTACQAPVKDSVSHCEQCGTNFPPCMVTGRAILENTGVYTCRQCKHKAIEAELRGYTHCPLCHIVLK
eukprot:TRINITY_DN29_c0_g1::TRINITY_DN29_c0_g1_i1::g.14869::m.14869 TRINITY_DN29_c0_g1::TRINITY_DN29_c0_g1_i1::g.14869  ORF type:complete len:1186 (-),score=401.47,sp/A6N6J5/WDR35_RAT/54.58/0.0,Coatomer_WDAD/PF04053.9/9.8e-05,Coatomer_WDAD/PF04053.9/15,WD40/PF00400.27/9.4,WD40/PF00400.27/7,WD40/PF00400.27/31,WD40/PF00400.27/2.5e+02,WD40/PF00400.27/6.1e+03,WD40/PF00400.27/1.8e+03,eIF2A/PF08662.6/0.00014,eIF2A/PF08662.6/4.8e+02,Clathrin/PF00637.15/2.1e+02,Clathrin/PF00637.15/9.7,Clathrin/PF00637.15/0.0027